MKEIVLITGGNGFVVQHLVKHLSDQYTIRLLTRNPKASNEFHWSIQNKTIDEKALENIDHIIHLAGANIFEKRWTIERKQEIISSRIASARLLLEALKQNNQTIKTFISASAIGYYGAVTTEKIFTENDTKGNDFLSDVVEKWENAADAFQQSNIAVKVVKLRTGVVFAKAGSALQKIEKPIANYVGALLGSGKQYMPWIHIDDLCRLYQYSLANSEIAGTFNAVAPQHITNKELTQYIAKQMHKPLWLPNIPAFVLKVIFGESACMLLEGSRISCERVLAIGFEFKYPDVDSFIKHT